MKICSVPRCGKKTKAHGYCQGHYLQIKTHGTITRPILGVFEKKICSIDGCNEQVKAKGLCSRHIGQFYLHGKIISAEKMHDPNRKCSVLGCGRKHRSNGYCKGHLGQFIRHGKIIKEKLDPRNGITTGGGGYVLIKLPNHPAANKRGYVKRCNLVWEEHTGQHVIPPACVHHKNGTKTDDSFSNLEYFPSDHDHQAAHHVMKGCRGFIAGGIL